MMASKKKGDIFYNPLPEKIWTQAESVLELKDQTNGDTRKFVEAFLQQYDDHSSTSKYTALTLKPSIKKFKRLKSRNKVGGDASNGRKGLPKLSKREKRKLGLMKIPKEEQKYAMYVPLHELWKGYMEELFKGCLRNPLTMAQKILKADLHGCEIKVSKSKCSSVVGLEGIIVQETQNTFRICCKDDRIKTIPKGRTVFTFQVLDHEFTLYGQNLLFRPADRSSRKFKDKPFVDI